MSNANVVRLPVRVVSFGPKFFVVAYALKFNDVEVLYGYEDEHDNIEQAIGTAAAILATHGTTSGVVRMDKSGYSWAWKPNDGMQRAFSKRIEGNPENYGEEYGSW